MRRTAVSHQYRCADRPTDHLHRPVGEDPERQQRLDHQQRGDEQRALLHAEPDQHVERVSAEGRLDEQAWLGPRSQVPIRGRPARRRRRDVHPHRQRRHLRAGCEDRQEAVGVAKRYPTEHGPDLLRLGQSRRGRRRWPGLQRSARRQLRRARPENRPAAVAHAAGGLPRRLQPDRRLSLLRRAGLHRHLRWRRSRARPGHGARRQDRPDRVGLLHHPRARSAVRR